MKRLLPLLPALLLFLTACAKDAIPPEGPRVGITYGTIQMKLYRFGIDVNGAYRDAVKKTGGHPVLLSVRDDEGALMKKLEACDGILIPGGYDVNPSLYGEKPDEKLEAVDDALDALEKKVLDHARLKKLPVLGICRGHQFINVYYGGSLYQDIPSRYKSPSPVRHRKSKDYFVYKTAVACFHEVTIEPGSMLRTVMETDTLKVNTYHHQAVKRLAPGFRVSARSLDGSVEAIEGTGDRFIMGVQFHPEKMAKDNPVMYRPFKLFMERVHESRTPLKLAM